MWRPARSGGRYGRSFPSYDRINELFGDEILNQAVTAGRNGMFEPRAASDKPDGC